MGEGHPMSGHCFQTKSHFWQVLLGLAIQRLALVVLVVGWGSAWVSGFGSEAETS